MNALRGNRKVVPFVLLAVLLSTAPAMAAPRKYTLRTLTSARKNRYDATTRYPQFRGTTRVVRQANYEIARWAREQHQRFVNEARRLWSEPSPPMAMPSHSIYPEVTSFQGPRLISVLLLRGVYLGGAHGMQYFETFNYGMAGGRANRLRLGDFFDRDKTYQTRITQAVLNKLRKMEGADWVQDGSVKTLTVPQLNRFTLHKTGLIFHFNPYEMGPYAAGAFEVQLSISDLGPHFKSAMLKSS